MKQVIILGGGIAGTTAAEELRKREPETAITLIEQEQHPCYSRVLLPHYIKGKVAREKVFLKSPQWYYDNKIDWMAGERVTEINLKNRFVRTLNERELPFDQLLLATGGELSLMNDDLRGVSYLRGVDDADLFLELIREVKQNPDAKAAVYGGGFISFEYINFFQHYNIPCTILFRGAGFWSSVLSMTSQKVIRDHLEKNGVVVMPNQPMPELSGGDRLKSITLQDGTVIPVDILGVGIGIHPEKELFAQAGIELKKGIVANEYLETAHEGVYAVGDGAEFFDSIVNRHVMYGNWMNAQMQGRAVAKTMSGERAKFELVSSYATNVLGLHVAFIGDVDRGAADRVEQVVATDVAAQERFYRNGKLVGAVLIGDLADRMSITQEIKKQA